MSTYSYVNLNCHMMIHNSFFISSSNSKYIRIHISYIIIGLTFDVSIQILIHVSPMTFFLNPFHIRLYVTFDFVTCVYVCNIKQINP